MDFLDDLLEDKMRQKYLEQLKEEKRDMPQAVHEKLSLYVDGSTILKLHKNTSTNDDSNDSESPSEYEDDDEGYAALGKRMSKIFEIPNVRKERKTLLDE